MSESKGNNRENVKKYQQRGFFLIHEILLHRQEARR